MERRTTAERRKARRVFSWYIVVFEQNGHSYKTPSMYSDVAPTGWENGVSLDPNVKHARLVKSGRVVAEVHNERTPDTTHA